jgi:hypothetical protein
MPYRISKMVTDVVHTESSALAIQPLPHQRIGPLLHQLGEHIGIQNHHQSKVTGLIL